MKLDPTITVAHLLAAIPSSAVVLMRLGLTNGDYLKKTLLELCQDSGTDFERFLEAMNAIDWNNEAASAAPDPDEQINGLRQT